MKITLAILISLLGLNILMGADEGKAVYYQKCVTCHGVNGEKEALGIAKPLNTLSEEEIKNTLNGYKGGTYGGKYKALKTGMARTLSEDDIPALTAYIQTLRPRQQ